MTRATQPSAPPADGGAQALDSPRAHRAWDDVPLRTKVTLLVLLAAVGGSLVGMAEAHFQHTLWLLSTGLLLLVVLLYILGHYWVWRPFERLVRQLDAINRQERATALSSLPLYRCDEVGKLARVVNQLTAWAIRDHHEARQLRRTLDDRVAEATRKATRQLQNLVMRDPLTNLGNRRFLDENLEPLHQSAGESGVELVAVLIDMDNFKLVNDTHGHEAGDKLLVELASLIQSSIRKNDYAVRLGGDEFLVLLPACDVERAKQFAEQLVRFFRQRARHMDTPDASTSLSIGVSSLRHDSAQTGRDLLRLADTRLYQAKHAGKNRIAAP